MQNLQRFLIKRVLRDFWGVIHVYFLHYQSFEEGVSAWKRRARRIQWNNIFVVLSEKDGCTKKCLEEFEHLSYESKVALTHVEYPDITCGFYGL